MIQLKLARHGAPICSAAASLTDIGSWEQWRESKPGAAGLVLRLALANAELEVERSGVCMKRILLVVGLLAGCLSAPAFAQTKVGDWEIEKRASDEHCNATRAYKDADDENRQNVIVLSYSKDAIVIVFVYEGWEWGKDDKVLKADFATDKATILKKAKWEVMDKTTLRGIFEFKQSILDAVAKAKRLSLDFEDDDDDDSAEFDIPRAGEALAALKFCEENRSSGAASPPAAAAPPPVKSSRDRE
jgi:hypothetical protein